MLKWYMNVFWIALGSLVYSVGLNAFIVGNHLAEGGFVGLSIVALYKLHIPLGLTYFVLNIPLLILGWKFFGRQFIAKTFLGVILVSVFTILTQHFAQPTHDRLLAALYGGVICGLGLGLIFRTGGTTGGSDILARIANHLYGITMGRLLFAIDVVVISLVALIIGKETAMYSLVALFVGSRVIDFVIEGVSSSRAAIIISEKWGAIAAQIHKELERGTTLLSAQGGYTGQEKQVVYCVVNRNEIVTLKRLVHAIDEEAFIVLNDVHDVLGEGFTR